MALMKSKQAAEYLSASYDVLIDEVRAGRLVGFKVGGEWRFDVRDLDYYIDQKRQEASARAAAIRERGAGGNVVQLRRGKRASMPGLADTPVDHWWIPGKKIEQVCAANAARAEALAGRKAAKA